MNANADLSRSLLLLCSQESLGERSHARKLITFQNERGGRVRMASLVAPEAEFNHPEKGEGAAGGGAGERRFPLECRVPQAVAG